MLSATSAGEHSSRPATVTALLARRPMKRARDDETEQHLQESCVSLLMRHQNTSELLLEITSHHKIRSISCDGYEGLEHNTGIQTSVLENELRRRSEQMGVPVGLLSARVLLENIEDLITQTDTNTEHVLLNTKQRSDVCALLKSAQVLMSAGIFSPELLWQEYWKLQPVLEVIYHLHTHNILTLDFMLERDAAVSAWITDQLKALCASMKTTPDDQQIRHHILSTVVCVLVRRAFEDSAHNLSQTCCWILDSMISWLLDSLSVKGTETSAAGFWVQVFDVSVFGGCVTEDTLQRFFTHTLMRVFTYRPIFKVSDVIAVQSEWSFAKTLPLLTALFSKICLVFSVECVLSQMQQVLETHEVNWRHILSCLSHLLIYHSQTQCCLTDLLSRLLRSAFDSYDVEKMITLFLLARQASLEGPAVFPPYSDWFKLSFGGSSGYHAKSKKSTVFLLKFLSDLVPYEPPQYLKVNVMHPPYIGGKYRSLLQEYITLAKTRLRDLKVSLEETGIFEVVNGSAGVVECPAQQDVEKAVTLFMTTNKVPATVIEASIFRRPYFLSRFLPALLSPRVLPVKSDARMVFIEALRKADKIPAALYTSYTESCRRETYRQKEGVCESSEDDHLLVLQEQFLHLRRMMTDGATDGDVCAQLSRISLTLRNVCADEETGSDVITLNRDSPDSAHAAVANLILQSFCLCLLDASKVKPPNRQGSWPSVFVKALLAHRGLVSALIHRLWDLLQYQVELHYCRHACPPVRLMGSSAGALSVSECLSDALICSTRSHMALCLRFCVAVLSYGLCRANAQSEELHNFIPERLYKKAQYVMARLVPETRAHMSDEYESDLHTEASDLTGRVEESAVALWRNTQIRSLKKQPQYQLSFSEWLSSELHVQRSRDALTDLERQEYEQWACEQYYLHMSEHDGGCEGDVTRICARIITAVLDRHTASRTGGSSHEHTDGCLPDLLSLLQAVLYEVAVTRLNTSEETGHFLWDVIDNRCSVTPDPDSIGHKLSYQQTLDDISRVLVLVPPVMLLTVRTDRTGRRTLDCQRMMKHISHVQRRACLPAGLLSFQLTAHFFKAVVSGSVSCDRPVEAVNACLSLFNTECPLLPLSAACWWTRLSAALSSQWKRLTGRDALPEQLQMLEDSHSWSRRVGAGCAWPVPSAPSWLLAACLHGSLRRSDCEMENVRRLARQLHETDRQVLLFWFVSSVTELISTHLNQQAAGCLERVRDVSVCLLTHLVDDSDWLLLFDQSGSDHRLSHFLSRVMSPQTLRLMPFAFYSILRGVESELLTGAIRSPGFLYSAAVSYRELSRLFLNAQPSGGLQQQVLLEARRVLMSSISLSSPDCLTLSQRRQLQSEYEQLDSEISAALSSFRNAPFT
ncbi:Fanconi anemia group A protein isoform X2 [Sinocyclocheilus grahami]|uniref:Fanconi anemia group A protein isoform X2 n=1 Tax=Sinocyclocheilus grahami TaxID=75366 RepID=UPI0007AC70F3|nr:PREDICTED: Fanconi anemia group A protein isoform X2 [Sinocyclocheilus grahami]